MTARVLASLALILVFNRLTGSLTAGVLLGTAGLAALLGQTPAACLRIAGARLFSADNFSLMAVIFLVIWLSTQMSMSGVMRDLVEAIRQRLGKRHAMAVLPAVIGFLPMPGGAIFSAPLVESCDTEGAADPILKARINLWFRHIWEFWWPIYPGVLLAMHITGLDVWQFMLFGAPLSIVAVAGGYFFLLRKVECSIPAPAGRQVAKPMHKLLTPIIIIVAGYIFFRAGYGLARHWRPDMPGLNRYMPMMFGILLAMAELERRRPLALRIWRQIVFSKKTLNMALIVSAVRVYGAFIEEPLNGGVNPVALMRSEMDFWGIPMVAMAMLLPFIAGLTTGLAIGFVGASFPIVMSLLGPEPPFNMLMAATALAYAMGHMGQMLSPVHVCLAVTNEHFKTGMFHTLRGLLGPAAIVAIAALGIYYAFARWGAFSA